MLTEQPLRVYEWVCLSEYNNHLQMRDSGYLSAVSLQDATGKAHEKVRSSAWRKNIKDQLCITVREYGLLTYVE
jgi:hypothetical protein